MRWRWPAEDSFVMVGGEWQALFWIFLWGGPGGGVVPGAQGLGDGVEEAGDVEAVDEAVVGGDGDGHVVAASGGGHDLAPHDAGDAVAAWAVGQGLVQPRKVHPGQAAHVDDVVAVVFG